MNVIRNIIVLLFITLVVFAFILSLKVSNSIMNSINETYQIIPYQNGNLMNSTTIKHIFSVDSDLKNIFITAIQFFIVLAILFSVYSSFIERLTMQRFVISFIGGVIIGGIVLFITTSIYNLIELINTNNNIGLDLSVFPTFFITNLQNIILANLVALTLSFVFRKLPGRMSR